ncbi:MAG: HDOD domain-containing protein [Pseudomonadota bacterium]
MTPESLVNQVNTLVSMPDIAIKINDLLQDSNSSAWDIGRLIEQDPSLSAAMLRIANSPIYNPGIAVTAVDRAVTMVGTKEVRDLAFGICAVDAFEGISNELITMQDFWHHCLRTAAAGRVIQRHLRGRRCPSLFVAGLLHDIGQLVMFTLRPKESEQALKRSMDIGHGASTFLAEREVFGFDHTQVGAALATQWNLPEYVGLAIRWHHDPLDNASGETPESDQVVPAAIHLANTIAVMCEVQSEDLQDGPAIAPGVLDFLGLDETDIPMIAEESSGIVDELMQVFVRSKAA